jgi:hypothetical protein
MGTGHHLNDEEIERYSMESVSDDECARIEEHLLLCDSCRVRLSDCDEVVSAMRSAAADIRRQPEAPKQLILFPARVAGIAAAAVLAVVLAVVGGRVVGSGSSAPPLAVALKATRGAAVPAKAPPGRALALALDLEGLPEFVAYRVSAVDSLGKPVWRGTAQRKDLHASATLHGTPAGTYFVRLYSPSGELLREYGLVIATR